MDLSLPSLFPKISMTLYYQVELFGPGPRGTSGLGAFLEMFLDLAVSLMGKVQAEGEETYSSHESSCHFTEG